MNKNHVVVCLSGGLDSTVAVAYLKDHGFDVTTVGIDYGQRHRRELERAATIASFYNVPFVRIDLSSFATTAFAGNALTDIGIDVPEGHYEDPTMKLTVVPNRNMTLLSIATAVAISKKATHVAYGAHKGDHAVYPDCRQEFYEAMSKSMQLCNYTPVILTAPFIDKTKTDIVKIGRKLNAPMHLTYSCYNGGVHHCGVCGTCVERREAFEQAKVLDPTVYSTLF